MSSDVMEPYLTRQWPTGHSCSLWCPVKLLYGAQLHTNCFIVSHFSFISRHKPGPGPAGQHTNDHRGHPHLIGWVMRCQGRRDKVTRQPPLTLSDVRKTPAHADQQTAFKHSSQPRPATIFSKLRIMNSVNDTEQESRGSGGREASVPEHAVLCLQ